MTLMLIWPIYVRYFWKAHECWMRQSLSWNIWFHIEQWNIRTFYYKSKIFQKILFCDKKLFIEFDSLCSKLLTTLIFLWMVSHVACFQRSFWILHTPSTPQLLHHSRERTSEEKFRWNETRWGIFPWFFTFIIELSQKYFQRLIPVALKCWLKYKAQLCLIESNYLLLTQLQSLLNVLLRMIVFTEFACCFFMSLLEFWRKLRMFWCCNHHLIKCWLRFPSNEFYWLKCLKIIDLLNDNLILLTW